MSTEHRRAWPSVFGGSPVGKTCKRNQRVARKHAARQAGLQEYVNVALRKLGLPAPLIRERLASYRRFEVAATTPDLIAGALDLHVLHGLSFYDALIVQAAQASGCQRVLREVMQNGARFGGVQIVNPFVD